LLSIALRYPGQMKIFRLETPNLPVIGTMVAVIFLKTMRLLPKLL
jgi:hypothetical protein